MTKNISDLPNATKNADELEARLSGSLSIKKPAVFLDYDGTLTPIVTAPRTRSSRRACETP